MSNYTTELDLLKAVATSDGNTDTLNVVVTSAVAPSGSATSAKQDTGNTSLASIDTKMSAATPAGSNLIGKVGIDQTTPGTTNLVALPTTTSVGTLATGSARIASIDCTGCGTVLLHLTGTWTAAFNFEISIDSSTWFPANGVDLIALTNQVPSTTTANGIWQFNTAGCKGFRIRGDVASGTVVYEIGSHTGSGVSAATLSNTYVNQSGTWTVASSEALAQASTTAGQSGYMSMGAATTAAPSYTTAKTYPLSLTTAGELRAVLSTTSSLAANQSCNVAQINGVTPLMGAGSTGTGSPRITIATDQAILTNAWKSNTAQINGVTPLMGNGVTGTGSQRVTLASDNTINTNTFSTRADTFTTTANGTTIDISAKPMSKFSIQVVATGAVTSWNVVIEGSLNNSNFTTITTVDSVTDGTGTVKFGAASTPCLYFRSKCTAISLGAGTNVVTTILGLI